MLQTQIINFTISIFVAGIGILLGIHAWRRRQVQGAVWLSGLLVAVAWVNWWCAFEAAIGPNLDAYLSLCKFEYIGTAFIPMFWIRFAAHFSGSERILTRSRRIPLFFIPVITILLVFTNEFHGLIWAHPQFLATAEGPVFHPQYGAWFWVFVAYSYIVFAFGSVILARYALKTWRLYRFQTLLILVGTALPWLGNLLTIFNDLNPVPYLYVNGFLMGLAVVSIAIGVMRLQLLDVMPLAYDTILNNIPDGILVIDPAGRILAMNDTIKQILNTADADLVGQQLEVALPICAPDLLGMQAQSDSSGQIKLNNRTYAISVSVTQMRDGQVRGHLFVFSDITSQIEAKRAQEQEEVFADMINRLGTVLSSSLNVQHIASSILENLELMIPHSRLNIMLVDADGHSTRLYEHRGYTTEEIAILNDMVFDYEISPLFVESVQNPTLSISGKSMIAVNGAMAAPQDETFATIAIMTDRKPMGFINIDCPASFTFTPHLKNRLQIFGQQAALSLKNAQLYEQTRLQAEELKSRVSSLTITQQVYKDIGFSINTEVLLQLILDAALRISRADAGFVALKNDQQLELAKVYGDYDLRKLDSILKNQTGIIHQTIAGQRTLVMQLPNALESGFAEVQAQIALPLFTIDDTEIETFSGVIILETKKASRFTQDRLQLLELIRDRAAVALQNVLLVNRVRERAAELEVLYGKVSYFEKFKTDMIRIAAHDLKNPLGVIRNYLTMLIDSPELELDLDTVYASMLRSAERMIQIVQNFLSMDRIEKAAQLQTMVPFDLSKVVSQAAEEFKPRATQKSLWMDVLVPNGPCTVRGDEAQIYEAVTNFISNAIKYTPEGGYVRVVLEMRSDTAQLEVTDNGFGIPEENQTKLFQPFYRSQTAETADIEGTGLGLHLTKTIIEQQDGDLIFKSVYHQGSTFGFKMPIYRAESAGGTGQERIA